MRAMICLYPQRSVAELLVLPAQDALSGVIAEPADDLHITLAYFPEVAEDEVDELLTAAIRGSMYHSPIQTNIEGAAQFFVEDGEPTPYVLLVNPDRMIGLRSEVLMNCGYLRPAQNHGFIPHITLAYMHGDPSAFTPPDIPDVPLIFDTISVKFGDGMRHDFRIGGSSAGVAPASTYRAVSEKIDTPSIDSETPEQPPSVPTTEDEMTDATETTSTDKAGRRMAGSWRDKLAGAVDSIKEILRFADYEDDDEEDKQVKMLNEAGNLLVFKDNLTGEDRWLSYSSNAFKDREGEIVSTKTLERMVEYGDTTQKRGPLRLFHIHGADIGKCDFQALQGRFLIESGTFLDTPLAVAGKAYIEMCSEELGTSIGFSHPVDALKDGVYHDGVITERSICPLVFAANPFTSFITLKGGSMNPTQEAWLRKAVGDPLANEVLSRADAATKDLEGHVAFKDNDTVIKAVETLKGVIEEEDGKAALDAVVAAYAQKAPNPFAKGDDDEDDEDKAKKTIAAISEALEPVAATMATMAKAMETLAANVGTVSAENKVIADRVAAVETATKTLPAGSTAFRASSDPSTVVAPDPETAKALAAAVLDDVPTSPVQDYVSLITGTTKNGRIPS